MRRDAFLLGLIATAAAGAAGIRPSTANGGSARPVDYSRRFARFKPAPEPNGDLSKVDWPDFVLQAPPEVKRLYEFQITHGGLMRYMPCYCGCGQNAGHRNNRDCYIKRVNHDGSVVFDSMAPT